MLEGGWSDEERTEAGGAERGAASAEGPATVAEEEMQEDADETGWEA